MYYKDYSVYTQGHEAIGDAMRRTSQSEGVDNGSEGRASQGEEPFEIIDSDDVPLPSVSQQEQAENDVPLQEEMVVGLRQRKHS